MADLILNHTDITLFLARFVVGFVMIYYGYPKIKDLHKNGDDFSAMGFKPGIFWGTIVASLEFLGSIALVFGILTELVAFGFIIHMATGTLWKLKMKKSFKDYSYDMLTLSLALVILTFGPGSYALMPPLSA
jgi:uncharacterized membrane protein YphA (DoxX/SURF4 family)